MIWILWRGIPLLLDYKPDFRCFHFQFWICDLEVTFYNCLFCLHLFTFYFFKTKTKYGLVICLLQIMDFLLQFMLHFHLCAVSFVQFHFFQWKPWFQTWTYLKLQMSTNIKPNRFSQVMWPNVMMFELCVAIFDVLYGYIAQSVLRASKGLKLYLFIMHVFMSDFKIRIYKVCLHCL